jgi:hypothetical protein
VPLTEEWPSQDGDGECARIEVTADGGADVRRLEEGIVTQQRRIDIGRIKTQKPDFC